MFQCSSASRKFSIRQASASESESGSFSALQRAENSQSTPTAMHCSRLRGFQCSSASRKFSIQDTNRNHTERTARFSALQRAENSQSDTVGPAPTGCGQVSVLFSEPKILNPRPCRRSGSAANVSVLFSEPKILNVSEYVTALAERLRFSALQRAENSQFAVLKERGR